MIKKDAKVAILSPTAVLTLAVSSFPTFIRSINIEKTENFS